MNAKVIIPVVGACLVALAAVPQFASFSQVLSSIGTFLIGAGGVRRPGDVVKS